MTIRLKRVYDPPSDDDGVRLLVDRLWPRGISRKAAALARWVKELAPSGELRTWFAHDPAKWPEFQRRYEAELHGQPEALALLREEAAHGVVTLVYGARDPQHNQALVLKAVLEQRNRKPSARKPAVRNRAVQQSSDRQGPGRATKPNTSGRRRS